MTRYNIKAVKAAARGRWDAIFAALAPKLAPAQERAGRHVPCPVHGGTDGFRLFKHYAENGDGICNTCGARTDGFDMLCWVNGWTLSQALQAVAGYLGLAADGAGSGIRKPEADKPPSAEAAGRTERRAFRGVIVFAGMQPYKDTGRDAYAVVLMLPNGMTQICWGTELQTALRAAGASRGDMVSLVKLRTEERRSSRGVYRLNFWQCTLLHAAVRRAAAPKAEAPAQGGAASAARDPHHASIEKLWAIAVPIRKDRTAAAPVLRYFARRGLEKASWTDDSLRFVPHAIYRAAKDSAPERWPAMVAAVRKADGRLVTLHRTFLTEDGQKAPVEEVKKLMALPEGETISGASIQLGKPLDKLCVAEGIETALSVQYAAGIPCWCAISANGLKAVEIPQRVRTVLIFADKDKSETGELAAEALRKRLAQEGRFAVIINIPDAIPSGSKGIDWNDVLVQKGPEAFPVREKA